MRKKTSWVVGGSALAWTVLLGLSMAGCKTEISTHPPDFGHADLGDMTTPFDMAVPTDQHAPEDLTGTQQDVILPPDAVVEVTYAELLQMFETAYCSNLVKCGQLDSSRLTACAEVARGLKTLNIDPDLEIQQGRIALNDATCAQAFSNARCDGTNNGVVLTRSCSNLFIPKQATGQSCISDLECAHGFCVMDGQDGGDYGAQGCASPGGHCEPYLAIGAIGDAASECDPAVAYLAPANSLPNTYVCVAYQADNAPCTYAAYGSGGFPGCLPGAFCKITTVGATNGTCTRPTSSGTLHANCDEWQDDSTAFPSCTDGLYCSHLASDLQNGLPACVSKIAQGQQCNVAATISANHPAAVPCVSGTECFHQVGDSTGLTLCHPQIAVNGQCVVADTSSSSTATDTTTFNSHCQNTLWCQPGSSGVGTCQPQPTSTSATATPNCLTAAVNGYGNCASVGNVAGGGLALAEPCVGAAGADGGVCRAIEGAGDSCDTTVDNVIAGVGFPACTVSNGTCSPATTNAPPTCHVVCP